MKNKIESFLEFLQSNLSAKEFIETIVSSAVTDTTDKPPETRIRKLKDKAEVFNLNKEENT